MSLMLGATTMLGEKSDLPMSFVLVSASIPTGGSGFVRGVAGSISPDFTLGGANVASLYGNFPVFSQFSLTMPNIPDESWEVIEMIPRSGGLPITLTRADSTYSPDIDGRTVWSTFGFIFADATYDCEIT